MSKKGQCAQCGKKIRGDIFPGNLCEECRAATTHEVSPDPGPGQFEPLDLPDRIGPYKIREVLGKGGMGIVYLADQEQPIRRRVALKVIKLGMDTEEVIARFESERQALALMNNPDIYSLGVLLYEILVGVLPYDPARFKSGDREGILKVIQEDDPVTPTKQLRSLGASAAEIARLRHTTPNVLRKQLRGDLDWITMKAMEKDRSRRYASASEFAGEIRRFQKQEPISARPPSVMYKLGKFTRRHRIGIMVGILLLTALVAGICGTTIGLVRARKAEKLAQKEAAQAKAINDFMQETLSSANPIDGHSRDITLLEVLENSVDKIHESFADQPEVEAELKRNIGVTFLRLGYYEKAETLLKESLDLSQRQFDDEDYTGIFTGSSISWTGHPLRFHKQNPSRLMPIPDKDAGIYLADSRHVHTIPISHWRVSRCYVDWAGYNRVISGKCIALEGRSIPFVKSDSKFSTRGDNPPFSLFIITFI
jgi:hypothetical protein